MKRGFTLVEILIVVAIIGLLASIAIPSFVKARHTQLLVDTLRRDGYTAEALLVKEHGIDVAAKEYGILSEYKNGKVIYEIVPTSVSAVTTGVGAQIVDYPTPRVDSPFKTITVGDKKFLNCTDIMASAGSLTFKCDGKSYTVSNGAIIEN